MQKASTLLCSLLLSNFWILFFPMTYYQGPQSDHFNGSHFFNPWAEREGSFWLFLKWKVVGGGKPWPEHVENQFEDRPPSVVGGLRVSFVGHSTLLIQTGGVNIVTDPVWSDKVGPLPGLKLKRVADPGIAFDHLPKIDLILLSHNHYDHMDLPTIQRIWERDHPLILCPLGNDRLLQMLDPTLQARGLDWEETVTVKDALKITLEPTQHWSARGLFDRNQALWGSYVIQSPQGNIYFAGDTGYYQPLFAKLKLKYKTFRFACLPIGSYEPAWFMRYAHLSPEEAVKAHLDLGSPRTLAIHYITFHLSDEGYDAPAQALEKAKVQFHIPQERFRALPIGQHWEVRQN